MTGVIWSQEMLKDTIKMCCREGSCQEGVLCLGKIGPVLQDNFIK